MIEAGTPAPGFVLPDQTGSPVSLDDLLAESDVLLAFYPADFSSVCTDQLVLYERDLAEDLDKAGVRLVGVSVDGVFCHAAFRDQKGITATLLADFHPKGEVAESYGAYIGERGHTNRSLVLVGRDGVVKWSYVPESPLDIPSPDLIRHALAG